MPRPERVRALCILERGTVDAPNYKSEWYDLWNPQQRNRLEPRSDEVIQLYSGATQGFGREDEDRFTTLLVDTTRTDKHNYNWWPRRYFEKDHWSIALQETGERQIGFNGVVMMDEGAQKELFPEHGQYVQANWLGFDCIDWKPVSGPLSWAAPDDFKPIVVMGTRSDLPDQIDESDVCAIVSFKRKSKLTALVRYPRTFHDCPEIMPWPVNKGMDVSDMSLGRDWVLRFLRAMRRGVRVDVAHREACVNKNPVRVDVALINGVKVWYANPALPPKLKSLPEGKAGYTVVRPPDLVEIDVNQIAAALGPNVNTDKRFEWDLGGNDLSDALDDHHDRSAPASSEEVIVITVIGDASGNETDVLVPQISSIAKNARLALLLTASKPEECSKLLSSAFQDGWQHEYVR